MYLLKTYSRLIQYLLDGMSFGVIHQDLRLLVYFGLFCQEVQAEQEFPIQPGTMAEHVGKVYGCRGVEAFVPGVVVPSTGVLE